MDNEQVYGERASSVIGLLHSGIQFYRDGIQKAVHPHIQAMFRRMLDEKERAIIMLSPFLPSNDTQHAPSHLVTSFRQRYTQVITTFSDEPDNTYINELTRIESSVLDSIDDALDKVDTGRFANELRCIRTRMQQCFDEMLSLSNAVE
ncbi:DUF2383 domain-containing protein [Alteromonas sp. CYL-A6]|uniref:DUF2383 domain-containing protein n=1 Tax=Alteromonas nitratireducens TaxID=3390813 RepID=UPI0034BFFC1B